MRTQEEPYFFPDGRCDTHNAALYTGLSEKTLAMKRCQGTGPEYIKRGRVFYFRDDLDSWLQGHGKVISTSQDRETKDEE